MYKQNTHCILLQIISIVESLLYDHNQNHIGVVVY